MIMVTGGAGFIGSCIVRMLNNMGHEDIIIVDNIASTNKWKNLNNKKYIEYIHKNDLFQRIYEFTNDLTHVIHMGACSSTVEKNFDYLYSNNFKYTQNLWNLCAENNISFIYASSAATYGGGEYGFHDDKDNSILQPLNGYGYSKQLFDIWASKQLIKPKQHAGFKFFNVYGPNEYFKGNMASVVYHTFSKIKEIGKMELFKSYKDNIKDGEQKRDFIYVKDICNVIKFAIENIELNGLFNLGTGTARTFNDLAISTFKSMDIKPIIEYIDMPLNIKNTYQYFTEASMDKLYNAGYTNKFYSLEDGIDDYVKNYLMCGYKVY